MVAYALFIRVIVYARRVGQLHETTSEIKNWPLRRARTYTGLFAWKLRALGLRRWLIREVADSSGKVCSKILL